MRPEARKPQARLEFAFVYPDRMGRNIIRKVIEHSHHIQCALRLTLSVQMHWRARVEKT